MPSKSRPKISRICAAALLIAFSLAASEQRGRVTFGGLPVPGATVTATRDGQKFAALSDAQGWYSFADLADGAWTIRVEMLCFSTIQQDVVVAPGAPVAEWKLTLPPFTGPVAAIEIPTPDAQKPPAEAAADDGLLINGSANNGADSPFSQSPVFGNNRRSRKGLYTGAIGVMLGNSALDARSFSLTGQQAAKPSYSRIQGFLSLGGPLRIPHLLPNGPNFILNYQWMRDRDVTTQPARMPTAAERNGDLGGGVVVPASRISPQAQALLRFYPPPNFAGSSGYNYQAPIQEGTHRDALQSRFTKTVSYRDQLFGSFAFESTRTDQPNLFGFLDTGSRLGINATATWSHRFTHELFMNFGYRFSRLATRSTPYFANRENVSGEAGIMGNNQDAVNWGPPGLSFASGIAPLSDEKSAFNRNQTSALSPAMLWTRGRHNVSFGGEFRRQQFNYLSQQDPRGTFTFTGAATGSDFGGFLEGIPDTSSIAFGNADKYFRQSVYNGYITDDWRIGPEFSLNAGMRWEYGAPITERYGRLVNLDIASGFSAIAPVVASDPTGPLTGQQYPASLVRPSKRGFEPRVGIAWRPVSGSSMVVRAGYGIYQNTSVYQTTAEQMAQQSPLSKNLRVPNSAANPLTLANAFLASASATPNTFAIDPNFRVGYAQNWQLSVQRDLPASLQMTATYLGIKGTRGVQEFLPNTYPAGAMNPCPGCPAGFDYLTSNANSTREAAQLQLRRRLHNGIAATLEYTYSKSIDNAAVLGGGSQANLQTDSNGGPNTSGNTAVSTAPPASSTTAGAPSLLTAQNWLNLSAERGLSNFDQRHLLSLLAQYTSGMGLRGGTLAGGWKGALLKEWTFATQISVGSSLPQTPVYPIAVQGTGVTGSIRPDYTGAPLYAAPGGYFLNPAAYTAPEPGQWGNAGRSSITGPAQFTLNVSVGRTFRLSDRFNLDLRVDAANALNHVTYTTWNTTVTSAQFGLPAAANAMRTIETSMRVRF
jgi:carboxypeptidase family protein